jgi:hypothetical protein
MAVRGDDIRIFLFLLLLGIRTGLSWDGLTRCSFPYGYYIIATMLTMVQHRILEAIAKRNLNNLRLVKFITIYQFIIALGAYNLLFVVTHVFYFSSGTKCVSEANATLIMVCFMVLSIPSILTFILVMFVLYKYGMSVFLAVFGYGQFGEPEGFVGLLPRPAMSEEDIRKIPELIVSEADLEKCEECVICLERLKIGEKAKTLKPCDHTFHAEHIDDWLRKATTCPLCRATVQVTSNE